MHLATSPTKPSTMLRALAAPIATGCCLAAAGIYLVTDTDLDDGPILCPYRRLTGLWCPGCGLSRATHHLLRGNVVQACSYHLFVVPVLAFIIYSWWSSTRAAIGRPSRLDGGVPRLAWVAVGVLLVFGAVRNLPGLEFLIGEIGSKPHRASQ